MRLSGSRLYVTGGTGFLGKWLLQALIRANELLDTKLDVDVLARDPETFASLNPNIASNPRIRLLRGDVTAPNADGKYDAVIHGAASTSSSVSPRETMRTIVDGTRAVIEAVARPSGEIPFLFVSSGAVYGGQRELLVSEDFRGELDHLSTGHTYHESKRIAELSSNIAAQEHGIRPKFARLFAFLGPGLPLDQHFAAGNFLRDALRGGPIVVNSGGTSIRSYLYPTDMIVWILAILCRGESRRAYNVGSDETVTIGSLARRIAALSGPNVGVEILGSPAEETATTYAPNVSRITGELGVRRHVDLDDAILRSIDFHRSLAAIS